MDDLKERRSSPGLGQDESGQDGVIKVLDVLTANQIAAGEVVERPVSIVKELTENAIDAESTRITIKIKQSNLHVANEKTSYIDSIELIDNGKGMVKADLLAAFSSHATSKIFNFNDLENMDTLGFRGEALPSIAAISAVTISSRTQQNIAGNMVAVNDGKPVFVDEIGMPVGTKILVEQIFYNLPARKKFLKSVAIEIGYITALVSQLILSKPEVAFVYVIDGRTVLHSPGNGSMKQAIVSVYGSQNIHNLVEISRSYKIKVNGFISVPPFSRSNRKYYHFFVNGRLVKSKELANIIEVAYQTLLPEKKYPMVVLYLQVNPATIDVNVHPAKTEIRFHKLDMIQEQLLIAMKEALFPQPEMMPELDTIGDDEKSPTENRGVVYELEDIDHGYLIKENKVADPHVQNVAFCIEPDKKAYYKTITQGQAAVENKGIPHFKGDFLDQFLPKERSPKAEPLPNQEEAFSQKEATAFTEPTAEARVAPSYNQQAVFAEPDNLFASLKPLGQFNASYILAAAGKNLFIIDQHAAHERIIYEEFNKRFALTKNDVSILALPVKVDLGNYHKEILLQNILAIAEFGFMIEHFGDSTFIIRGIPAWYSQTQSKIKVNKGSVFKDGIEDFFITILDKISFGRDKKIPNPSTLNQEELFSMACKSAVKANQALVLGDILWLFSALSKAEKPLTCPHGRPTIIKISEDEIKRRFMRS